ncbi:MAG: PilW family protein [Caldimonas sp.]
MAPRQARTARRSQLGLSLIELLVGVAIGLIGILAMFQTLSVWSKHTQATASGGDAQIAGTLALFNIERDMKLAGLGFSQAASAVMGCTVTADDAALARAFQFRMRPVDIAASAGGAPDSITVVYGNSSFFATNETFNSATASTKRLVRRNGFKAGDLAIVAGNAIPASSASATCQLVEITDTDDPDGLTVGHTALNYVSFYAASAASGVPRYNLAAGTGATFTTGTMYDLGPQPRVNTWAIANSRRLERTDAIGGAAPFQLADGIINLKAQYGVDGPVANGRIEDAEWTNVAPADWTTVLAIRVAVLVRGQQFERNGDPAASVAAPLTAAAPTWAGGTFLMTNVDGTPDAFGPANADPNNWRYYRYRVYERVIPLRNMLWGTLP